MGKTLKYEITFEEDGAVDSSIDFKKLSVGELLFGYIQLGKHIDKALKEKAEESQNEKDN